MQKLGHNPIVVTYEPSEMDAPSKLDGSTLMIAKYAYQGIPVIALKHTLPLDYTRILDRTIAEAAPRLSIKCDLMHVFHPMWLASLAQAYKNDSIPVVMTLTDTWLLCPSALLDQGTRLCNGPLSCDNCPIGARKKSRFEEARSVYEMADELTSASHFTPFMFQRNGLDGKAHIIPHSVNYQFVKESKGMQPQKLTFGFIGTLAWHKGVHVLVKACRQLAHCDFRVKIYGSPYAQWDYFKSLVDLTEGDERIQFPGAFDLERSWEIMCGISALVIPSVYYENYPLVMLLAFAHKVPVIASNIGGMPELIRDGENGFLFEMGNYRELAGIMEKIAKDPGILHILRANITSPRRIEEEALDYETIYKELVQGFC
jgi:glycosyltransferase involved in cell wall biosynthesis